MVGNQNCVLQTPKIAKVANEMCETAKQTVGSARREPQFNAFFNAVNLTCAGDLYPIPNLSYGETSINF